MSLGVTIRGTYPQTVPVGHGFPVVLATTTGRPVNARVWLDDGVTQAPLTAPGGFTAGSLTLYPVATRAGNWHLWASVDDGCGNVGKTGVVRTVVVQ